MIVLFNSRTVTKTAKQVVVVTSGGIYTMYDFNNGSQGGEDNGNALVQCKFLSVVCSRGTALVGILAQGITL